MYEKEIEFLQKNIQDIERNNWDCLLDKSVAEDLKWGSIKEILEDPDIQVDLSTFSKSALQRMKQFNSSDGSCIDWLKQRVLDGTLHCTKWYPYDLNCGGLSVDQCRFYLDILVATENYVGLPHAKETYSVRDIAQIIMPVDELLIVTKFTESNLKSQVPNLFNSKDLTDISNICGVLFVSLDLTKKWHKGRFIGDTESRLREMCNDELQKIIINNKIQLSKDDYDEVISIMMNSILEVAIHIPSFYKRFIKGEFRKK